MTDYIDRVKPSTRGEIIRNFKIGGHEQIDFYEAIPCLKQTNEFYEEVEWKKIDNIEAFGIFKYGHLILHKSSNGKTSLSCTCRVRAIGIDDGDDTAYLCVGGVAMLYSGYWQKNTYVNGLRK